MTLQEFSNSFDVLLNSFGDSGSKLSLNLDEYEKSVFLTQAQEQIVIELYTGRTDKQASFEATEELRTCLRGLIKTDQPELISDIKGIYNKSIFYKLNKDVLFITYESVTLKDSDNKCIDGKEVEVVPVTQDEFHRIKKNPFRSHNNHRVLRLDAGSDIVELVSDYALTDYKIRYLKRPTPIVLEDFSEMTDDPEFTNIQECNLDPSLHRYILDRAVVLALRSRGLLNV